MPKYIENPSSHHLFSELEAFCDGHFAHAWRYFGAHPATDESGQAGYRFRLWAPNATTVSVLGDFNQWDAAAAPMKQPTPGVWECFLPALRRFDAYQYAITTADGSVVHKSDPFAFHTATRPETASKLYDLAGGHVWGDRSWLAYRARQELMCSPLNIYECHLGSWRRTGEGTFLSYRDTCAYLVPYLKELGYTHVQFLPVTEHPEDATWGYGSTGYFAPTSRFGPPDDFKFLVDQLHQAGIGVLMDFLPAQFPTYPFGLHRFDGGCLFEAEGEFSQFAPFDVSRGAVRSFLTSSALFWLEEYHLDGLRLCGVSSLLEQGDSGRSFLLELNRTLRATCPHALLISDAPVPKAAAAREDGGLGFHFVWNTPWFEQTDGYVRADSNTRQALHHVLTGFAAACPEQPSILPLSHDGVVGDKGSLFGRTQGDDETKFAALRAFYAYTMTHPGKKLTFMGPELGQWNPWRYQYSLDWHLLQYDLHRKNREFFKAMNAFYLSQDALWEEDFSQSGFQWLRRDDSQGHTLCFLRYDKAGTPLLVACNFSDTHYSRYHTGVPFAGTWSLLFSTDCRRFGGQGRGDKELLKTRRLTCQGQKRTLVIDLPPMTCAIYRCVRRAPARKPKVELPQEQPNFS